MSRTIGRRRPASSPIGDVQAGCSYCGNQWLRSRLTRTLSGTLTCEDCNDVGHDPVAISMRIKDRQQRQRRRDYPPAEHYDRESELNDEAVHLTNGGSFS